MLDFLKSRVEHPTEDEEKAVARVGAKKARVEHVIAQLQGLFQDPTEEFLKKRDELAERSRIPYEAARKAVMDEWRHRGAHDDDLPTHGEIFLYWAEMRYLEADALIIEGRKDRPYDNLL